MCDAYTKFDVDVTDLILLFLVLVEHGVEVRIGQFVIFGSRDGRWLDF